MSEKPSQKMIELDQHLVDVAKPIKILSSLAWPASVTKQFLDRLASGEKTLPKIQLPHKKFSSQKKNLQQIALLCDQQEPLGNFLYQTATNYYQACQLLEHVGQPQFSNISAELYGTPSDIIGNTGLTTLEVADHFIKITDSFAKSNYNIHPEESLTPEEVVKQIKKSVRKFFIHHKVKVILDPNLASKAAAGGRRIRIRSFASFSKSDLSQLLHHEAFVHTLTSINGREQPNLKSLSLDAPRTLRTQEGLAMFAELITHSIDLKRLRRISLRVKAIDLALNGANFLDIFDFFQSSGQNEHESFQSSARIFRGGDINGKIIFSKDLVYLQGFVHVHTFLQNAISAKKLLYPNHLCAGKLSTSDILLLEPYFISGYIEPPIYLPQWITNRSSLVAFLTYLAFAKELDFYDPSQPS